MCNLLTHSGSGSNNYLLTKLTSISFTHTTLPTSLSLLLPSLSHSPLCLGCQLLFNEWTKMASQRQFPLFTFASFHVCVCMSVCVLKAIITPDEAAPHACVYNMCMCVCMLCVRFLVGKFDTFVTNFYGCTLPVSVCVLCMDTLPLRIVVIVVVTYCCCCCCLLLL